MYFCAERWNWTPKDFEESDIDIIFDMITMATNEGHLDMEEKITSELQQLDFTKQKQELNALNSKKEI